MSKLKIPKFDNKTIKSTVFSLVIIVVTFLFVKILISIGPLSPEVDYKNILGYAMQGMLIYFTIMFALIALGRTWEEGRIQNAIGMIAIILLLPSVIILNMRKLKDIFLLVISVVIAVALSFLFTLGLIFLIVYFVSHNLDKTDLIGLVSVNIKMELSMTLFILFFALALYYLLPFILDKFLSKVFGTSYNSSTSVRKGYVLIIGMMFCISTLIPTIGKLSSDAEEFYKSIQTASTIFGVVTWMIPILLRKNNRIEKCQTAST